MTPAAFIDDPDWTRCIAELPPPGRARHLPAHEDCAQLDVEETRRHLQCGGTLGTMSGYEERAGQIEMCGAIANAFNRRAHLMVEAGTGTGKSLAYLIPSVLWAWTNDTPVIVSTATRNLQSQLVSSDIPRALEVLGDNRDTFKVALLKGRGNYLCLRALAEFFAPGYWTMSPEEQALMPDLINWLTHTTDGDLDTYEGLPRNLLSCPGEECSGRRCPYYTRCFVFKARKAASEAHLVIANHSLVLAEATAPGSGILPNYGRLVMDEAHNLEDIATEYLSYEFSLPALTRILNRLVRKGKGKRMRSGGLLSSVERQFRKGAFSSSPMADTVMRQLGQATRLTVRVVNAAEDFLEVASRLLTPARPRELCRYRVEKGVRSYSLHGLFKPYGKDEWEESAFRLAQSALEAELAAMVNLLHELRDALNEAVPEGELNYLADLSAQAETIADSLVAFANETNFVIGGDQDTHAYWVERVRQEKRASYLRMVAAPLSVAAALKTMFYEVKDSVVLCSATLRVGSRFTYMAQRLGFSGGTDPDEIRRYGELVVASPFDYFSQASVLAPDCLPDPSSHPQEYAEKLAELMRDLFEATGGRALVLFTSYEMMQAVAAGAREPLAAAGIELLVQGEGLSREAMTQRLKGAEKRVVIFGAQSFWEGVDVAGEALSCVVMARLPFAQVGDPIVEARSEQVDRAGGSAFRDYALPEAVIRFRQGFGRLIRTRSDRGVVIVSDPRLVTKSYGAIFRKSIPASVHTVSDPEELLSRVMEFYTSI